MPILYFGKIINHHLLLLAVTIGYCILGLSKTYVSRLDPIGQDAPFKFHPIFFVYCMFFSECLMLIIYLIQQRIYSTKINEKKTILKGTILYIVLLSLFVEIYS